jgi:hypothetical protein
MQREFYEIYRDLEERYRASRYPYLLGAEVLFRPGVVGPRTIEDAISDALGDLGLSSQQLRPDARLFLLVNLHEMIVLPLSASPGRLEGQRLAELLRNDVRTILEAAREPTGNNEISGHAVINAISRVWDKLRATELDVWG